MAPHRIAVMASCYNRKQTTLRFLQSLTVQPAFANNETDVYLLDDGSTDGTAAAIAEKFPFVKVVPGSGALFWAGGMRTVWQHARAQKDYDLFLLCNDDVVLFENALGDLVAQYERVNKTGVILVGSTLSEQSGKLSYGGFILRKPGHCKYDPVLPDEQELVRCHLGNGNILMVDRATVQKIGIFTEAYTHYFADFDYTLRASQSGIDILVPPGYYGYCEDDHGNKWLPGSIPLKERIRYLYSPKGMAFSEHLLYIKKHFPGDYFSEWSKLWLQTLFPIVWDTFKRGDDAY
ncbi:glycosyltransferase family 2 protein [Hufsiella ginkgonis]|uniref:Glycosyltransferase n=1 Tax=Hufsiella ginkgonis TaxID=2695274 RepID=A0A7K1Y3F9_9SPHI|nr:glycosyltransferase family 2 protein [Hufsiella ginkgonis]MXV17407.1 glycosyltransferase [Hufsiella ginkgonis]